MNTGAERIRAAISGSKKPALVAFTVAGDPDYKTSLEIIRAMADSGADIIELGLPFSDPIADGPVIQRADLRAMDAGMNTDLLFELVREFRRECKVPVAILTYTNLILQRGIGTFYHDAAEAGIDALVIADLPYEEAGEYIKSAKISGVAQIMMVSQTTSPERMKSILSAAEGFIYLVAVMGVTGARTGVSQAAIRLLHTVKEQTTVPVAPGFGISSGVQVREWMDAGADAVIVGSAIVKKIEENLEGQERIIPAIREIIRELKG